nr:ribonuclease H-like domain-containing protein [Tanacetum cinerariifolium]
MWLFRHKYFANDALSRYKARFVANGSTQLAGIDVDETFTPVVKSVTIRTVLSLATSRHSSVHHLDVKNTFLHCDLSETVYMHQPLGFRDSTHPDYVYLFQSRCDSSLFIFWHCLLLLVYVDDIVLTASSETLLQQIITSLHQEFSMTDLSSLNYFMGISVTRDSSVMFLSQRKYAAEILDWAHMANCNLSRTPVDTESKQEDDGWLSYYLEIDFWLLCISWQQPPLLVRLTLSRSSAEAEYLGVANVVAETFYSSSNPVQHQRTKHININIHFVIDLVAAGQVRVLHVLSRYQYAAIFTYGLPSALFEEFHTSLSVRCPPAQTLEKC